MTLSKVACFFFFLIAFTFLSSSSLQAQHDDIIFEEETDTEEQEIDYPTPEHREMLSPEEFIKIQKANSALLLDVRGKAELKYGVIENSINIPIYELETNHQQLPKNDPIVIFCDNGMRALFAYDLLYAKGFRNISFLNYSVAFEKSGTYRIITHNN